MELDGLPSTVMPLPAVTSNILPNEYVSGPGTYVAKFWWIQLKYLRRYCNHPVFGSLPAV